jgi:hypothetical protein
LEFSLTKRTRTKLQSQAFDNHFFLKFQGSAFCMRIDWFDVSHATG